MQLKNFTVAIYCPVRSLIEIGDMAEFEEKMDWLSSHVHVGKMYLETYRTGITIQEDQLVRLKNILQERGIALAGGITTDNPPLPDGGFSPMCYNNAASRALLSRTMAFTAKYFDEIILDDFFFTNCRCETCIEEKGGKSWPEYRVGLMAEVSKNVIIAPAKAVNPHVKVVIKYPNWYEHYQDAGYNLKDQPALFDGIYTGTETRNPAYTQQHLPKYLSYFLMRYLENTAPGRNGGGWFDPYECTYNVTSYLQQPALTLLAGAKEATMFSLGSLMHEQFRPLVTAAGQLFRDMDMWLSLLGRPQGTACYLPFHSRGEDFLHNYVGMLGIPLEAFPYYPENADRIFLTESAATDADILVKVKKSLLSGADVIVTSGFLQKTQDTGFAEFANLRVTGRKAASDSFAYTQDGGLSFSGCAYTNRKISLPQVEFPTNDTWVLAAALGRDNNFPVLMRTSYGKGKLFVLAVPEDAGELYDLPKEILNLVRMSVWGTSHTVIMEGPANICLFVYDNHTFALHSFLPHYEKVDLVIRGTQIKDLQNGVVLQSNQRPLMFFNPFRPAQQPSDNMQHVISINVHPGVTRVYRVE